MIILSETLICVLSSTSFKSFKVSSDTTTVLLCLTPKIPGLPFTLPICLPAIIAGLKEVLIEIKATLPSAVSKNLGAAASSKFIPTPACTRPLSFKLSKVLYKPSKEKSKAWLLLKLVILKPIFLSSIKTSGFALIYVPPLN